MIHVDIAALSGITGSISIACWVVVFSPQIIENFRRSSAEGLSITFVVIWLGGDVFNIAGAVLQKVLPTMIILAVYYTLADIVLLAQCLYYRNSAKQDDVKSLDVGHGGSVISERSGLLSQAAANDPSSSSSRRSSFREHLLSLDGTHLSPATPMHAGSRDLDALRAQSPVQRRSVVQAIFFNFTAVVLVCAAGVLGWYMSQRSQRHPHHHQSKQILASQKHEHAHSDDLKFNVLGQVFGYICAVLYLGSRIPQLLLNYRRKSTEGISMLFFLFACIGNLAYVMSVLAYEPICRHPSRCVKGEVAALYLRYFIINLSWLIGSFGTLGLDAGVFVQYFLYQKRNQDVVDDDNQAIVD